MKILSQKAFDETINIKFVFNNLVSTITTIDNISIYESGTTTNLPAMLSGSGTISGTNVTQLVTGGTLGKSYIIACTIISGQERYKLTGKFTVVDYV